jgi:hypothetical protein
MSCSIRVLTTISILILLSYTIFIKSREYLESKYFTEANLKIISTYTKYRELSYYKNRSYTLIFDYLSSEITVKDSTKIVEIIKLPKEIDYYIPHIDVVRGTLTTTFTDNGNLSHAFTIYLLKKGGIASYRIGFYTFSQLKFLILNIYKNLNSDKPFLDTIESYHNSSESQNLVNWQKE